MHHIPISRCKFGVFQYVVTKNLMSIIICILASYGYYDEGDFRFTSFYLYSCVLNNASQCWALLCLLQFYFVMKDELAIWRPVGKYTCIITAIMNQTSYYHTPYTIYHIPYTIYHTPYTIYHIPYTIYHTPYTIHHTLYTIYHIPYTIHHIPYT
ncbi:OSTA/TMEM184 family protein, partial [archaeon]